MVLSVPIPAGDLNAWVHLALVYDGSTWNLYRNGQLGASAASTTGAIQVGADWSIGSDAPSNPSDPRSFQGSIDEVYIDSAPLNQQQVQTLMNATPPAAPTGLTATGVSTSEIDLTWTNNATDATAQEVWWTADGTTYSLPATLPANATGYASTGLTEATYVGYAIRTITSGGVEFGTPAYASTLPAAPSALTATANEAEPIKAKVTTHPTTGPANQYGGETTPKIRFVGLLSPVVGILSDIGFVHPLSHLVYTFVMPSVANFYQGLDNHFLSKNPILWQHQVQRGFSPGYDKFYEQDGHVKVGHDPAVRTDMWAAARSVGVPLKS